MCDLCAFTSWILKKVIPFLQLKNWPSYGLNWSYAQSNFSTKICLFLGILNRSLLLDYAELACQNLCLDFLWVYNAQAPSDILTHQNPLTKAFSSITLSIFKQQNLYPPHNGFHEVRGLRSQHLFIIIGIENYGLITKEFY